MAFDSNPFASQVPPDPGSEGIARRFDQSGASEEPQIQDQQATDESGTQIPREIFLRSSIALHEHEGNSSFPSVVLEDTASGKYFRLGESEALFIKLLWNTPVVSDAYRLQLEQQKPLTEQQIAKLCQWLQRSGLVEESDVAAPRPPSSILSKLFFFRIPLLNPDRTLTRLESSLRWLFSWQVSVAAMVVALIGACIAVAQWTELRESYANLFTPWRGTWLFLVWIGLKVVHETAHGGTCKRYGGSIPEAGLAMILLVPIAYVDVTSCWRFPSKWQRLHVTLAGVIAELCIAGLAMMVLALQ